MSNRRVGDNPPYLRNPRACDVGAALRRDLTRIFSWVENSPWRGSAGRRVVPNAPRATSPRHEYVARLGESTSNRRVGDNAPYLDRDGAVLLEANGNCGGGFSGAIACLLDRVSARDDDRKAPVAPAFGFAEKP